MNFLAHCALAGADGDVIVGSFLGDFVKGPLSTDLPTGIQRGVRLHRRIDAYSNVQSDIKASVGRFPGDLRRIGPVFVDLIADHFLARDFERHYADSLADFSRRTYDALHAGEQWLTYDARAFRRFVEDSDMFERYRKVETVARGFRRVAERLRMPATVEPAVAAFRAQYEDFGRDFERYYPDIRAHAAAWLADQSRSDDRSHKTERRS